MRNHSIYCQPHRLDQQIDRQTSILPATQIRSIDRQIDKYTANHTDQINRQIDRQVYCQPHRLDQQIDRLTSILPTTQIRFIDRQIDKYTATLTDQIKRICLVYTFSIKTNMPTKNIFLKKVMLIMFHQKIIFQDNRHFSSYQTLPAEKQLYIDTLDSRQTTDKLENSKSS